MNDDLHYHSIDTAHKLVPIDVASRKPTYGTCWALQKVDPECLVMVAVIMDPVKMFMCLE